MNVRQERKSRSIQRSVRLLRSRDVKGPEFEPLIQDLEKALARIQELIREQRSARKRRRSWADIIARLRGELRDLHMYRISRRGPGLMKWAAKAELAFHMPHETAGNATLIASARAMVKVVALKPTLFTKDAGFRAGFLALFRGAIRALEEAIASAEENTRQLSRLTAELARRITHGRAQLRVLDGLLRPLMRANKGFAEEWRRAWKIPETLGAPKKKKKKKKDDDDDDDDSDESDDSDETPTSSDG